MGKKSVVYPSKTTINLVIKEKSKWRPGRVLPMVLALAAAVVLFGKFAVADRLAGVAEAFAAAQLERGFKTLDFYKSLQIPPK